MSNASPTMRSMRFGAEVRERKGTDAAGPLKGTRFALHKNPWNLTLDEKEKLATLQRTNRAIYRGYLLKESLADILDRRQPNVARRLLEQWTA